MTTGAIVSTSIGGAVTVSTTAVTGNGVEVTATTGAAGADGVASMAGVVVVVVVVVVTDLGFVFSYAATVAVAENIFFFNVLL